MRAVGRMCDIDSDLANELLGCRPTGTIPIPDKESPFPETSPVRAGGALTLAVALNVGIEVLQRARAAIRYPSPVRQRRGDGRREEIHLDRTSIAVEKSCKLICKFCCASLISGAHKRGRITLPARSSRSGDR
jgi:hypothetical protein